MVASCLSGYPQIILPPNTSLSPSATDANILREHLQREADTGMVGGVTTVMSGLPPAPGLPGYLVMNVFDKDHSKYIITS